jgi:type IV pilus biogenesis protein CpaD/CtpE
MPWSKKHMRVPLLVAGAAMIGLMSGCAEHGPVMASPCPAWVDYPKNLHSNDGSPYLGCVNHANLEQMLADKHDLKKGRTLAPVSGAPQAKAVQDYEQGKVKLKSGGGAGGPAILLQGSSNGGGMNSQ